MSMPATLIEDIETEAADKAAAYRYHLLRAATERFKSNLAALDEAQHAVAAASADQSFALEELVLGSAEAAAVVIAEDTLAQSLAAIASRFDDPAEFDADLARNGLDTAALKLALRRELVFNAVMQRIGSRHAEVTETDARLFHELHQDRFQTPERRSARHILITVNDDYAENTRDAALARAEALVSKLREGSGNTAQRFARLARRHSECPTAMEDGKLGDVVRGQLYPQVDAALFALDAGGVSPPTESELGFHILLCERIEPPRALAFPKVKGRIRAALQKRRQREAQRSWIAQLKQKQAAAA